MILKMNRRKTMNHFQKIKDYEEYYSYYTNIEHKDHEDTKK